MAVLDTGLYLHWGLDKKSDGSSRSVTKKYINCDIMTSCYDKNGHGTPVASVVASSVPAPDGTFNGISPDVDLVTVRAFNENGSSSYADVIAGIDWVVANRIVYNIKVVNLSFSAEPRSHYWDDPLNQAVMAVWQAGIVVVASAGNTGPEPMTIGVPGNVPYIITVGAKSDHVSPANPGDDFLASFSAAGPTHEGFFKPEIVAPGGHVRGIMDMHNEIPKQHPEFHDLDKYFVMPGTSQATAVVSGVVALLLQAEPALTPDEV